MKSSNNMPSNGYRVLVVYHYIAKYREPIFARLAVDNDIDVTIAASRECPNDIAILGDPESSFPDKFRTLKNRWITNNILWQSGLLQVLHNEKYDAIILLGDPHFITTWLCLFYAKVSRKRTFLWTHGFIGTRSWVKDRLTMAFFKLSTGLLLYGDGAKHRLKEYGIKEDKLHVVYNSLDYRVQKQIRDLLTSNDRREIRRNIFAKPENPCLLFVGRLTFHKRLDILVDLLAKLQTEGIDANLLLVGDGEATTDLIERVNSRGLSGHVCFFGKSYDEETIGRLIFSADVCIAPGEVGLTAMHSLAYGTPVITHDDANNQMPEFEAVIDGYTGRLFEFDSFNSLVKVTKDFLRHPIPDVRQNCIRVIEERYTPEVQSAAIKKAIGFA